MTDAGRTTSAGSSTDSLETPRGGSRLDRRAADLARLADERWDVLVVGGGVTGCGAALDAASRGLRVALVERDDIAAGTSSRSSRLIHGGLRYLEQFRVTLVHEALTERGRLLRNATHLVRLEPLLFPLYGNVLSRPFYGTGLWMYDLLGAAHDGGRHRFLGPAAALEHTPALRREGLRGGFVFHDGVEDDARLALAVARTAEQHGAVVATRVRAHGALHEGRRVRGARVTDGSSGTEFDIRARAVIDATGVWAGRADGAFPARRSGGPAAVAIRPSRGSHIIVRRDRIASSSGLTIRVPGKVVFLVPWPDHWIIGTTDLSFDGQPDDVVPTRDDVAELLATVNRTLDVDLTRGDLVGAYAGLRPLVADESADGSTVQASREHRVTTEADGLTRIGGGKYTTYRVMARDVVDAALDMTHDPRTLRPPASSTEDLPLVGAAARTDLDLLATALGARLAPHGLEPRHAERLVARHGTEAVDVVELGERLGLLRPLAPDVDHLEAEVVWAVRHEHALDLPDVLARRTRLAQERPDRAASIAPRVAALVGTELDWSRSRRTAEVTSYLRIAHHDFDVPPETDDGRPASSVA
ncbi:MAG: glycerol-3-phosphate dehydrogenase/oxidase [Candidatus Limnocylindrales bacterium]